MYLQYLLNPIVSYIYLGRKFRLCVVKSDSNYVKLYNGIIYVCSTSTSNSIKINFAVNNWYRKRAKIKFNERLRECLLHLTARRTIEIPDLIIKLNPLNKKISCYYESCNVLLLNMNFIRTPIFFIDYVIYHSIFFLILKRKNCNFISLLPENIKKKILSF
ncbi:MAG: M48 family metallopeptidase [Wolbachia endosymbiont of Fragariocoptes setiger]|nr:M48 family metallopeptidase [Wolbachia endosymbiont of Fragariocoptes setiger]